MTTSPKLTDTQLVLLSSAAQRDDHLVVLPEKLKGGAAKATVTKLLSLSLVQELPVKADEPHWRRDENDHPIGLKLTRAGLLALGIEPDDKGGADREHETGAPEPSAQPRRKPVRSDHGSRPAITSAPREGSKQALVISLLKRNRGATLDELVGATGWLPHTTRAALTGLRQKGFVLAKSKNEAGKTVYRIEVVEPAQRASSAEPNAVKAAVHSGEAA